MSDLAFVVCIWDILMPPPLMPCQSINIVNDTCGPIYGPLILKIMWITKFEIYDKFKKGKSN